MLDAGYRLHPWDAWAVELERSRFSRVLNSHSHLNVHAASRDDNAQWNLADEQGWQPLDKLQKQSMRSALDIENQGRGWYAQLHAGPLQCPCRLAFLSLVPHKLVLHGPTCCVIPAQSCLA